MLGKMYIEGALMSKSCNMLFRKSLYWESNLNFWGENGGKAVLKLTIFTFKYVYYRNFSDDEAFIAVANVCLFSFVVVVVGFFSDYYNLYTLYHTALLII